MMRISVSSFSKFFLATLSMGLAPHCFSASPKTPDPILKEGFWEVVVTESVRKDSEVTKNWCVGPKAKETQLAQKEFDNMRSTCKFTDVKSGEGRVSYTRVCAKSSGVNVTSRVVSVGDFASEFTQTQTLSLDVPTQMEGMTQTQRFKYKGTCPKDMAPGDTVTKHRDGPTMDKWNRYNPPQPSKAPPSASK
jgi:hypothetical protein